VPWLWEISSGENSGGTGKTVHRDYPYGMNDVLNRKYTFRYREKTRMIAPSMNSSI
jgi:hypothetical protein